MPTPTTCYPWWHKPLSDVLAKPWAKTFLPVMTGCTNVVDGKVPCQPAKLAAFGEAWLKANNLEVFTLIGGKLPVPLYTLARYIQSEGGSASLTERVAIGQVAMNKSKGRVDDLLLFRQSLARPSLLPYRGWYGPIHGTVGTTTAPFGRWAATTRAPTLANLVIASFVWTGKTAGFTDGTTQWGPEYLPDPTNKYMGRGTTPARVMTFVRSAANDRLYWVGPLPGVDPWQTWLAKSGPAANTVEGQALIAAGAQALALDGNGKPIRRAAPSLPICGPAPADGGGSGPPSDGPNGTEIGLAVAGLAAGIVAASQVLRKLGHIV